MKLLKNVIYVCDIVTFDYAMTNEYTYNQHDNWIYGFFLQHVKFTGIDITFELLMPMTSNIL